MTPNTLAWLDVTSRVLTTIMLMKWAQGRGLKAGYRRACAELEAGKAEVLAEAETDIKKAMAEGAQDAIGEASRQVLEGMSREVFDGIVKEMVASGKDGQVLMYAPAPLVALAVLGVAPGDVRHPDGGDPPPDLGEFEIRPGPGESPP